MRIELAGGSVERLVNVWRDSKPLAGWKSPRRVAVPEYGIAMRGFDPRTVASVPVVDAIRWQQFLVENSPEGDKLLAALREGPAKVRPSGDGAWVVDMDRIERP